MSHSGECCSQEQRAVETRLGCRHQPPQLLRAEHFLGANRSGRVSHWTRTVFSQLGGGHAQSLGTRGWIARPVAPAHRELENRGGRQNFVHGLRAEASAAKHVAEFFDHADADLIESQIADVWKKMAVDMRLPLSLRGRAMFALTCKPLVRNLAKARHLFRRDEGALVDVPAEVREGGLRFPARLERRAVPRSGLIAEIDAPSTLVSLPDASHTSMLLESDLLFGGDLLEEPSGRFGDRHLAAFPAGHGVRTYANRVGQGYLRPAQPLSKCANFLTGHSIRSV
jgi:hypothetical protein